MKTKSPFISIFQFLFTPFVILQTSIRKKMIILNDKKNKKVLQLMGTLDRGGVEAMVLNLLRNGFETDICLEIPDKGVLED